MRKGILHSAVTGLLLSGLVQANEYKEISANGGEINWTTAKITASGYGRANDDADKKLAPLLACRAATVDAQRNLLETVQGTRITSATTVDNFMLKDDSVKTSVEGVIKGARVTSRAFDRDKVCTITMAIDMNGPLAQTVYQAENGDQQQAFRIPTLDWIANLTWNVSFFPTANADDIAPNWVESIEQRLAEIENRLLNGTPEKIEDTTSPTGLVIDARGSNFIPSLSPKIREIRSGVIYPDSKSKSSAISNGHLVSLFATDVDFAIRHPKVGDRPLVVKALRTYGDTRTEIVLGKESSEQLREMTESNDFVDAGVIIVLD
jgi:hypothetical protein